MAKKDNRGRQIALLTAAITAGAAIAAGADPVTTQTPDSATWFRRQGVIYTIKN